MAIEIVLLILAKERKRPLHKSRKTLLLSRETNFIILNNSPKKIFSFYPICPPLLYPPANNTNTFQLRHPRRPIIFIFSLSDAKKLTFLQMQAGPWKTLQIFLFKKLWDINVILIWLWWRLKFLCEPQSRLPNFCGCPIRRKRIRTGMWRYSRPKKGTFLIQTTLW